MSLFENAILYDVIGVPAASEGILFVPALLEFDEEIDPGLDFELHKYQQAPLPPPFVLDDSFGDVVWVRARIPNVFQFSPAANWDEDRYWLFESPFIAVFMQPERDAFRATPFICAETKLNFARSLKDKPLKHRIANAFWRLLLADRKKHADFEDQYSLPDDGLFMIGCTDGFPFAVDVQGYFGDEHDLHLSWMKGQQSQCFSCQGAGEEFDLEFVHCTRCNGTGVDDYPPIYRTEDHPIQDIAE